MLKKKNIALVMAAATVATTVAPVFAAVEAKNVDEATLIAEVTKLFNTKYTDGEEECVYTITVNDKEVKTLKEFKNLVEEAKMTGDPLTVLVTDNGHKTDSRGNVVRTEKTKNRYYATSGDDTVVLPNAIDESIGEIVEPDADGDVVIKLKNKSELVLRNGDYALNLGKPVDANGNAIVLVDGKVTDESIAKRIVGFEKVEEEEKTIDIASKLVSKYKFSSDISTKIEVKYSTLVTEEGFTQEGKNIVDALKKVDADGAEFVNGGKKYLVRSTEESKVVAVKDGGYKLEIALEYSTKLDATEAKDFKEVKYIITDSVQKNLVDLQKIIVDKEEITVGKYQKLAGESRFDTAVKISEETYDAHRTAEGDKKAEAIVLVGEDAIVDGLAAAPLATQENAPILLTKKDSVTAETMNEIKRVVDKGTDIYLVGGENVISKDVEAQLIKEMNANIIRLAGNDRVGTSLKIAEKMDVKDSAFVVGADGEADAMSIASIASYKNAPIIVTPAAGLTKETKKFLDDNGTNDITVVGGTSKISTSALKDVKYYDADAERIAGETRHETNADVIAKYAAQDLAVNEIFVAKDGYVEGNGKLIDALAVAPLAATKKAPIVLATGDLTKEQNTAIKEALTDNADDKKLVQVGGGVATTVTQKLLKLLGL